MIQQDLRLLEQWRSQRNAEAFRQLVERYTALVYSAAHRVLGHAGDAEDVTQECFQHLATDGKSRPRHLGAWLHTLATRRAIDRLRSDHRRRTRERDYAAGQPEADPDSWDDLYGAVDEAIAELPEKLRVPLVAHYLQGESYTDLSRDLGTTRQNVTYRVTRGIEAIRKNLKRRGITVGAPVLVRFLTEGAAEAAPQALKAALVRIALAGQSVGARGAAVSATVGGAVLLKKGALAGLVLCAVLLGGYQARRVLSELAAGDLPGPEANPESPSASSARPSEEAPAPVADPALQTGNVELTFRYALDEGHRDRSGAETWPVVANAEVELFQKMVDEAAVEKLADRWALSRGESQALRRLLEGFATGRMDFKRPVGESRMTFRSLMARLQGSELSLDQLTKAPPEKDRINAVADARGIVSLDGIPAGRYVVRTRGAEAARLSRPGRPHYLDLQTVTVAVGETSEETILVADMASLPSGVVTDADTGKPIAEVRIDVRGGALVPGSRTYTNTDQDGEYTVERGIGFGEIECTASAEDYLPATIKVSRAPCVPTPADLQLKRKGILSGHVRTSLGTPVEGAIVYRGDSNRMSVGMATTDEDGFYSTTHEGGKLKVHACLNSASGGEVYLDLAPNQVVEQDLTIPAGCTVRVSLVDHDGGAPKHDGSMRLQWRSRDNRVRQFQKELQMDRKGQQAFHCMVPGTYDMACLVPGRAPVFSSFVVNADRGEKRVVLRLGPPAKESVTVRALNAAKEPLTDTWVELWGDLRFPNQEGNCTTSIGQWSVGRKQLGGEGRCVFDQLAPGQYTAIAPQASLPTETFEVPRVEEVVLMAPPRERSARYSDGPKTYQVPELRCYDATHGNVRLSGDVLPAYIYHPSGRLSYGRVEAGRNRLFVRKAGYPWAIQEVGIEAGEEHWSGTKSIDITFTHGGEIEGRVQADAEPASHPLYVYPLDMWDRAFTDGLNGIWYQLGQDLAGDASPDTDGRFTVRGLPTGQYIVATSGECHSDVVEVVAGHVTGPVVVREENGGRDAPE